MPRPLSFDHLQTILRQHTAGLPDVRKPSPNTRYTIQNAALGAFADIEQPLTQRNLVNLAHILPKQSKDVDLHLVETFNEVVNLTVYAHPDPMNPFEQLENPA